MQASEILERAELSARGRSMLRAGHVPAGPRAKEVISNASEST